MNTTCSPSVTAILLVSVLCGSAAAESPSTQPVYRLSVGQRLVYDSKADTRYGTSIGEDRYTVEYIVVRRNEDTSWHIVGETSSWCVPSDPKREPIKDPGIVSFDLTAQGKMTHRRANSVVQWARHDPVLDFPALPAGPGPEPWRVEESNGVIATYRRGPATRPGLDALEVVRSGPVIEVFRGTRGARIWFDGSRGIVRGGEDWNTTSYNTEQTRQATTDLTADETLTAEETVRIGRDVDACLSTVAAADALVLSSPYGDTEANLARAMASLREGRAAATRPAPAAVLRDYIESLQRSADSWRHQAAEMAAVVGKPAPDWNLADLDGHRHALPDQRGKVVVLDFWFRGCANCIAAAPHLASVAAKYKESPVAVFGVSVDRDVADARAAAKVLRFPYPTLRDDATPGQLPTPNAYHVEAYPTVIVIGPDGAVRYMHVGYEDDLGEHLVGEIRQLLPSAAEKPAPLADR